MAVRSRLDWKGKQVTANVEKAVGAGLRETGAELVLLAALFAPRDTGFMANTMMATDVKKDARGYYLQWGNWTAAYTIWQEIGSNGRPGRFFLRRSADIAYPKLAGRIRARL